MLTTLIRSAIRSALKLVLVLLGVSLVVFLLRYLGGDPVALMLPLEATPEEAEALRRALGLDAPPPVQYIRFLEGLTRADFGTSLAYRRPALDVVLERVPATLELTFWAFVPPLLLAVPTGVFAAVRRGRFADRLVMSVSLLGQAVPIYWSGTMAILIFSVYLRMLPTGGHGSWEQLLMPAATLGMLTFARTARMVRTGMAEELSQDYVTTARAKGATERRVIYRHALRNALLPVVTLAGLDLGVLLGGAILTETIFAWPGIGRLVVRSIATRDFPVIQTIVLLVAVAYVVILEVLNVIYQVLDPRIRTPRK